MKIRGWDLSKESLINTPRIFSYAMAAYSVAMIALFALALVHGPCANAAQQHMTCQLSFEIAAALGAFGAVAGQISSFSKTERGRRIALVAALLLSTALLFVLFVAPGVCPDSTMECNAHRGVFLPITLLAYFALALGWGHINWKS